MMSCQENRAEARIAWIAFGPAAEERSHYLAALCVSGPLGRADGETVVQQDDRPADRLRPGHRQPERVRAGQGKTKHLCF